MISSPISRDTGPTPDCRFLVFTSAGRFISASYLRESADRFDRGVVYYGSTEAHLNAYRALGIEYLSAQTGYKIPNFLFLLQQNPQILMNYDYIAFVDDDIEISGDQLYSLFRKSAEIGVSLSQPAHSKDSFKPEYRFLFAQEDLSHQFVSFIEAQCFCVSTEFLRGIVDYLPHIRTGYGLDMLFSYILRDRRDQIALFHDVRMHHPYREEESTVRVLDPQFAENRDRIITALAESCGTTVESFVSAMRFQVYRSIDRRGREVDRPFVRGRWHRFVWTRLYGYHFKEVLNWYRRQGAPRNPAAAMVLYAKWRMYNSVRLSRALPAHPWMAFETKRRLDSLLQSDMCVFEYGSGASTLFFEKRVAKIVSIEHDPEWYERVRRKLRRPSRVDYRLVPAVNGDVRGCGTSVAGLEGMGFERYVQSIRAFEDEFFDVVVVDGRSRLACLAAAVPKVRPGGYLILDDTYRSRYDGAADIVPAEWSRETVSGPAPHSLDCLIKQTTLFRRP